MGLNFNLMDQLVFYGSYHQKKGNQLIHFFFVPLIMWSVSVWLAYTAPLSDKLDLPAQLDFLPPNIAAYASQSAEQVLNQMVFMRLTATRSSVQRV